MNVRSDNVKYFGSIVVLAALVLVAPAPFIAHAASVSPNLTTPSLDQVYAEVVDLRTRVLKLEVENRALKAQAAAMATHTHSVGFRTGGDGGSMSLRQMKYWLDHNECMDCTWQYRLGASRTVEQFSGPPKL